MLQSTAVRAFRTCALSGRTVVPHVSFTRDSSKAVQAFAGSTKSLTDYTALIKAHAKEYESEEAYDAFQELVDRKITPDKATRIAVFDACSASGDHDRALMAFQALRQSAWYPEDEEEFAAVFKGMGMESKYQDSIREAGNFAPSEVFTEEEIASATQAHTPDAFSDAAFASFSKTFIAHKKERLDAYHKKHVAADKENAKKKFVPPTEEEQILIITQAHRLLRGALREANLRRDGK
eukprot:JP446573.1.p1 GENE.JP446573.1~~JP446573.1.p1  ORF type:complete len:237 (-),score=85.52 JP446573.1:277-987(-)